MALLEELGQWRWASKAHARSSLRLSLVMESLHSNRTMSPTVPQLVVCGGDGPEGGRSLSGGWTLAGTCFEGLQPYPHHLLLSFFLSVDEMSSAIFLLAHAHGFP